MCSRISSLVDPGEPIPADASRIHGIYDHDVVTAPTTSQSLPTLLESLRGQVVAGYNIEQYDFAVLSQECRRCGLDEMWSSVLDTIAVVDVMPWASRTTRAPAYRRGARTLATMSARHGIELTKAHRAADDAEASGWLMLSLIASGAMPPLQDVVAATRR